MAEQNNPVSTLQENGLKNRHIMMIALGGVIGAGLFVGSSAAIVATGPAILLGFLMVGILIFMIDLTSSSSTLTLYTASGKTPAQDAQALSGMSEGNSEETLIAKLFSSSTDKTGNVDASSGSASET